MNPRKVNIALLFSLLLSWTHAMAAEGVGVQLTSGTSCKFAEESQAASELKKTDSFIERLSPFDRAARMKTDKPVAQKEFLQFISTQAQAWQPDEIEKLTPVIRSAGAKLATLKLPLPPTINLIKTTGREEGGAAYCRGNSIIVPGNIVAADSQSLENTLMHESFHIASRNNPQLRKALYMIIGFLPCSEIACPKTLAERKITNPDAPIIQNYILVTRDKKLESVVPILFSNEKTYDCQKGGDFFSYLTFKLMVVELRDKVWTPSLVNGSPILLDPKEATGFLEQIGGNTNYIIHPEEILADNFVLLLNGKTVPTPRIIDEMKKVLLGTQPEK